MIPGMANNCGAMKNNGIKINQNKNFRNVFIISPLITYYLTR